MVPALTINCVLIASSTLVKGIEHMRNRASPDRVGKDRLEIAGWRKQNIGVINIDVNRGRF